MVDDDSGPVYRECGYNVIYPQAVREAIESVPQGEDLVLEVNSGGGSAFSGFEIYSILRGAKCRTVAEVQSLAGSAASTIACGCDEVIMSPVAQMMIHDPALVTVGNIREHRESLQALKSIKEGILNGYLGKCRGKTSRDELDKLMSRETWLSAQDCVRLGLADSILAEDGTDPGAIYNAAQAGFWACVNSCALPPIEELLALKRRHECENSDHAGGEPADMAWQSRAKLMIEQNRY